MERPGVRSSGFSSVVLATLIAFGITSPIDAANAPPQFGNFFSSGLFRFATPECDDLVVTAAGNPSGSFRLTTFECEDVTDGTAEYPIFGRVNIAENNSPVPTNRIYFRYNYYRDSLVSSTVVDGVPTAVTNGSALSVSQYTFGAEKTLAAGRSSVEIRLPVFAQTSASIERLETQGGSYGNLAIVCKYAFYNAPAFAAAAGLGCSLPTGDDARFEFPLGITTLENRAVHLQPFLGMLATPSERTFCQGFLQLDVPLNANHVHFAGTDIPIQDDDVREQAVLFLDLSIGYWLYRDRSPRLTGDPSRFFTGLAPIVEVHYTTSLEDGESARNADEYEGTYEVGDLGQRFDMLTITCGLHAEFYNRTEMRVAAVFPFSSRNDSFFTYEVYGSIIRKF